MKITKARLRAIIKEELSILTEGAAKPPDIELFLNGWSLEAGIHYDFGGDGVTEDWHIIPLRLSTEDIMSRLGVEGYPDNPVDPLRVRTGPTPTGEKGVYWS